MAIKASGRASGHGRVYQQGEGTQLNVDRAYFGSYGELLPWVGDLSKWPLVRESDPLHLGVHRARISNGNAVPRYIQRDVDNELSAHLADAARRGGFVLLLGDSTAGKSRAAYEALQKSVPDHRVFVPDAGPDLRSGIIALFASTEPCVLWLDDFERYLGVDGLTASMISQLSMRKIVILATMRTERHRRLMNTFSHLREVDDEHTRALAATEHVLNLAISIFLARRWSHSEIARAGESDDERIVDALQHSNMYGLAEYLAAGPKLYDEWQQAWDAGASPRGAALVAAAVDCTRVGLTEAVPVGLLDEMHGTYLDRAGGALLRPESLAAAIDWAERRRYGVTSLLLPGKIAGFYRVFDYLPDTYLRSTDVNAVPDPIWDLAVKYAQGDRKKLYAIATAAENEQVNSVAELVWKELAQAGDGAAAEGLSRVLWRAGNQGESIRWLQVAVGSNNSNAAFRLGWIYEGRNDLTEAEKWFGIAAEAGHAHAMLHLAQVLARAGRLSEAESWGRRAADENENQATATLGKILAGAGRLDEAKVFLAKAGDEGDGDALVSLGVVLDEQGTAEGAEEAWRRALDLGSKFAAGNLALLCARQERFTEAESWYRKAIDLELPEASRRFGVFLMKRRRNAEAVSRLKQAADEGDSLAYYYLGLLHYNSGRNSEAEQWLRKAIVAEVDGSFGLLASTLERLGRDDEADHYYKDASGRGDLSASLAIGSKLSIAKRHDEAEVYLRLAATVEAIQTSPEIAAEASCELGRLLYYYTDRDEEAEYFLKLAVSVGHTHANCTLAEIYLASGRPAEAEGAWRVAYNGGSHIHAAERLVDHYMKVGRPKDASLWLGRARRVNVNSKKVGARSPESRKKNRRSGKKR